MLPNVLHVYGRAVYVDGINKSSLMKNVTMARHLRVIIKFTTRDATKPSVSRSQLMMRMMHAIPEDGEFFQVTLFSR